MREVLLMTAAQHPWLAPYVDELVRGYEAQESGRARWILDRLTELERIHAADEASCEAGRMELA